MSELPTDAIREAIDKTYRVGYVYEYTQDKANIQLRALLDALAVLEADRDWWKATANKWQTQYEAHNPFSEVEHIRKFRDHLIQEIAVTDLALSKLEPLDKETNNE